MVRALVIDGSSGDALRRLLTRGGVRCDVARSLSAGLDRLRPGFLHRTPSYDAIVAHLELPDAHGADVVQSIRRVDPMARVVAVAEAYDDATAHAVADAGARRFVALDHAELDGLADTIARWADLRQRSTRELFNALKTAG